ncbi:MAG: DUF1257 domain-containing protein [Synechococcales cyanobacterium T60_A2020_003]|nr:DUF1257 domain-containing protein [Synechococcales cyanobacterium T60_A2020_003]
MSHFTTIQVQIKDGDVLAQALNELGYDVEPNAPVRGYQGSTTVAEYVIRQANGYDLGFRKNGEFYELVADFWGTKINQQEFLNAISQRYAHAMLLKTAARDGFTIEDQETLADGSIRVVVGRWV